MQAWPEPSSAPLGAKNMVPAMKYIRTITHYKPTGQRDSPRRDLLRQQGDGDALLTRSERSHRRRSMPHACTDYSDDHFVRSAGASPKARPHSHSGQSDAPARFFSPPSGVGATPRTRVHSGRNDYSVHSHASTPRSPRDNLTTERRNGRWSNSARDTHVTQTGGQACMHECPQSRGEEETAHDEEAEDPELLLSEHANAAIVRPYVVSGYHHAVDTGTRRGHTAATNTHSGAEHAVNRPAPATAPRGTETTLSTCAPFVSSPWHAVNLRRPPTQGEGSPSSRGLGSRAHNKARGYVSLEEANQGQSASAGNQAHTHGHESVQIASARAPSDGQDVMVERMQTDVDAFGAMQYSGGGEYAVFDHDDSESDFSSVTFDHSVGSPMSVGTYGLQSGYTPQVCILGVVVVDV